MKTFALLLFVLLPACGNANTPKTCKSHADCYEGYACDADRDNLCRRKCEASLETPRSDCPGSQTCETSASGAYSVCREDVDLET